MQINTKQLPLTTYSHIYTNSQKIFTKTRPKLPTDPKWVASHTVAIPLPLLLSHGFDTCIPQLRWAVVCYTYLTTVVSIGVTAYSYDN